MAIKAGNIVHVGNDTVLIDRIQTAGPGQVNINRETVREVGNYLSVGQVADTPDLSFSLESWDVSCAIEALMVGSDPHATPGANSYNLAASIPLNVKSQFKGGLAAASPYATVDSVAVPYLTLESMSYRFGLKQNAAQTATLKGSEIYYNPGSTYVQTATGTNTPGQTVITSHSAYAVTEGGVQRRTLAVSTQRGRLTFGVDYTESYGAITSSAAVTTVTITAAVPVTDTIYVVYASPTVESFAQSVHTIVTGATDPVASSSTSTTVHATDGTKFTVGQVIQLYDGTNRELTKITSIATNDLTVAPALSHTYTGTATISVYVPSVKPAAIRGRDIDVYISGTKKISVQDVQVDWKVQLQADEEFGNYHYVDQDFDTPDVTGTITFKPRDAAEMLALMQTLSGTTDALQSAPATTAPALTVSIVLKNPLDGRVLKVIHIPDARFDVPGYSARVLQKLDFQAKFTSDTGAMTVRDYIGTP